MKTVLRHLPNLITTLRLAAAPTTAGLLAAGHFNAAFGIFAFAGLSDAADGFLAKRFNLNGSSFSRSLKESGTPLLAVPIPQEGRRALFLLKDVAAQVRIPPLRTITA